MGLSDRQLLLSRFGVTGSAASELLAYNDNVFDAARFVGLSFPLPDEPHIAAWRRYAADAEERGFLAALAPRFPQLNFPIEAGISESGAYRDATRRGLAPLSSSALALVSPGTITLRIHPTIAGALPVIIAAERDDFETLVRAFSCRNEPDDVPLSMGACIVTGLNNWDRVAQHKSEWRERNPDADEAEWKSEFARLVAQKPLYQDRFLILSSGPYSAASADSVGIEAAEWSRLSLRIRLEHECTHYFTYRVLGSMRNNLLDELVADYAGLVATFGSYRREMAQLFFGLEEFPSYRCGARLENYRGSPELSAAAFAGLQQLVHAAIDNIAAVESRRPVAASEPAAVAHRIVALAGATLEELADSEASVEQRIDRPLSSEA